MKKIQLAVLKKINFFLLLLINIEYFTISAESCFKNISIFYLVIHNFNSHQINFDFI